MKSLHYVAAENFLSLAKIEVRLDSLSVLVGPNGSGKTNFLRIIQFLGETARTDLAPAIEGFGGFRQMYFRGALPKQRPSIRLEIRAAVTKYASDTALDEYALAFREQAFRSRAEQRYLIRQEAFRFKRTQGRGRRITIKGSSVDISEESGTGRGQRQLELAKTSSGLSTLPRLGKEEGAEQVYQLASLFESFRVFEIDVAAARRPSPVVASPRLASDARNLAAFLNWLAQNHEDTFELLEEDLHYMLPGFVRIHLEPVGGPQKAVELELEEEGLTGRTPLAQASFGTVRALALLAMLHDPNPPRLTCVEEIDHGLHPYALDRIVERLRSATRRTQLLVATHSPAFVNRLEPEEVIICERDPRTGASRIPAIDPATVKGLCSDEELALGELWFSGVLGGVLP